MLNTSGFGWNDEKKCVEVDSDEAWQSYVQHHKNVEGWRNKTFPIYERFAYIFGKVRATGKEVETLVNMIEKDNLEVGSEIGEGLSPMSMDQGQTKSFKRKWATLTDLLVGNLEKFAYIFQDVMEKSNQNVNNILGKLSNESINSQVVANMLIKMSLLLHQRVRVQKMLLKQPEHAETFRIMQNDEERKEFLEELILGGYND
ncbi:hypothetical protein AB3S75_003286 [Citrus x aurantiifolia]